MTYQEVQRQTYYARRVGEIYGSFEVIAVEYDESKRKQRWTLRCIHCGAIKYTLNGRDYVKGRNSGICKCQRESVFKQTRVHKPKPEPVTHHELYSRWCSIKARCYSPTDKDYGNYGARGITMCDEWRTNFWSFAQWAYDSGYAPGLTIDRKDNDAGYSPDNCRWVERADQNRNKRGVILNDGLTIPQICEAEGVSLAAVRGCMGSGMTLGDAVDTVRRRKIQRDERRRMREACNAHGVSYSTVERRMKAGMTFDDALNIGGARVNTRYEVIDGQRKTIAQWCKDHGVLEATIRYRMRVKGMTFEEALTSERYPQGRPKK